MKTFSAIKFFRGYVYVRLTGYAPERFLNLCGNHDILIWELRPVEDGYEFYISVGGYKSLKPILKKTGTRAKILKKRGTPFLLFRYRRHKAFAAGLAFGAALLYVCSGFVWNIEVDGNSYLSEETILAFLKEEGAGFGSRISAIDCEALEEELRTRYDEVVWTSVKIYGTKLTVELQESLLSGEENSAGGENAEVCDIVAAKDGVISSIITRTGTPCVTAGMEVAAGDVLVSGRAEITNDDGEVTEYLYPGADADIIAEVSYFYTEEINIAYQDKIKTGRTKTNYGVRLFDYRFTNPFFANPYENYDLFEEADQFHFTDNFYLPLYFVRFRYEEYEILEKTYTKEEAETLGRTHFSQYIENLEEKGIQILEKNVMIEETSQNYVVTGTATAYESIVSYEPTEILEIKSEENLGQNESD